MNTEENKVKSKGEPWPTRAVMNQIYENKLWGGSDLDFYSGAGSHDPIFVAPYIEVVQTFLKSFNNSLSICDLGCGDFNVGKELVKHAKNYVAVDIVSPLINRNKSKFQFKNLVFKCLDIAIDPLPKSDVVLLRQVLQHLSNNEIQHIISKLKVYKYIILTEHLPSNDFQPNKDIIAGQGIRLKKQSGVNLVEAPFNLKVKASEQLLNIPLKMNKGVINTTLYTLD